MQQVTNERYVTNARGQKVSVILPYRQYNKLIEDLHDLAVVAERRDEKSVSLSALKKELKKNGQL